MVVLADPLLEAFFDVDLPQSFQLESVEDSTAQRPQIGAGLLGNVGGFLSSFVTDDNKKIFNSFVDDMGKAIGKHQVSRKTGAIVQSNTFIGHTEAFYRQVR